MSIRLLVPSLFSRFRGAPSGAPLAVAVVVLTIASCGPRPTGSPAPAGSPAAGQPPGWVHGQVVRPPGLDPRSGSGGGGGLVPVSGDFIAARDAGGRTAATAVSARDGSFAMSLPPGAYTVIEGICRVTGRVDVRGGAVASLTLTIPNAC